MTAGTVAAGYDHPDAGAEKGGVVVEPADLSERFFPLLKSVSSSLWVSLRQGRAWKG
jgi:hypothetical protein